MEKYRGYHPIEFVVLQYHRYKNLEISESERDREIVGFLCNYLSCYYSADVITLKDLFLSNDKESQLLGLQMCCRDFIDTFNLVMEINHFIIDIVINYIQRELEKSWD